MKTIVYGKAKVLESTPLFVDEVIFFGKPTEKQFNGFYICVHVSIKILSSQYKARKNL